jgi:5-formyltetrahydrofolate cyclo-ligase
MTGSGWKAEELLALGRKAKKQIRARMRGMRRALPASAVAARSRRIIAGLEAIEAFRDARAVALFWPLSEQAEVDLRPLDEELRRRGVARYYPFMTPTERGHQTGFRRVEETEQLALRGQKFLEPPPESPAAERGDLDVVLVPALAVTEQGERVGQGSGFYDVTLPDVCPPALSIVVAYSFQLLGELPLEDHDFSCDAVVTDDRVLDPRGVLGALRR